MSGIVGIFNLDGRPVDPLVLDRMTEALAVRGPDGGGQWISGPLGLGHRMLHTTPESLQEALPLSEGTDHLGLTLDGRVDNRDELAEFLGAKGISLRTRTDSEIVLRAYQLWGEECPARILGDFAFAIWDGRKAQLLLARDIMGVRPLYYYRHGSLFLFASSVKSLLEHPEVARALRPNEGMIGEILADSIVNIEETLYDRVLRLPPAHLMTVRPDRFVRRQYWDFHPGRDTRCSSDSDYREHFLDILRRAVQCRLRSHGPVAALLSGGLDSSSVVSICVTLLRDRMARCSEFETFSLVFPGAVADEGRYIRDVLDAWRIKNKSYAHGIADLDFVQQQVERHRDLPPYANSMMFRPILEDARERGFRVLLTGEGGDEWLTGSVYHYADMLRERKFIRLVTQLLSDSPLARSQFLRCGLWPLLPYGVRSLARRALGRDRRRIPPWITPQFADRADLRNRLLHPSTGVSHATYAQRDIFRFSAATTHWHETDERWVSQFAIEQRHPLHDRRLIEFSAGLPEDQRWRRSEFKFILRVALKGVLPESVRQRLTKCTFDFVFVENLKAARAEEVLGSGVLTSLGWLNREETGRALRRIFALYSRDDLAYSRLAWPAWATLGIEVWMRHCWGLRATQAQGVEAPGFDLKGRNNEKRQAQ